MDYISLSPFHFSKVLLNCVIKITNISENIHWINVKYKLFIH